MDMTADIKYELAISSNNCTVSGKGFQNLGIVVNTNATAVLAATSNVSWITDFIFTGSGDHRAMTGTFDATAVSRTANVVVRAGNLTRTIKITQTP